MDIFTSSEFRLLRLAARFRPYPGSMHRCIETDEVVSLVEQLMSEGIYADEFAYLDDPHLGYLGMLPIMERFLTKLNWRLLGDESEFRFMTALYSKIGQEDDVAAFYSIRRWMEEVGREMGKQYHVSFVADKIGANLIYGCYYSYSEATGTDLIPSVGDPTTFDWENLGESRPKTVFASWLARHPKDFSDHRPIDPELLKSFRA